MSNINQTQDLFALDTVQDLDNETAATCSGGVGYLYGSDPDVVLYKDPNGQGMSMGLNAATNDGIPNIGFSDGQGVGFDTTFNDSVSSIMINRGSWQFFADSNYGGDTTGRLEPGVLYNLGHNDDNLTSALRVV